MRREPEITLGSQKRDLVCSSEAEDEITVIRFDAVAEEEEEEEREINRQTDGQTDRQAEAERDRDRYLMV